MAVEGGRKARKKVEDTTDEAQDTARDAAPTGGDDNGGGAKDTLTGELRDAVREAAVEVLKPVARKATLALAKAAVSQGPSLMKDKVAPMVTDRVADAGGAGEMFKGIADKGGSLTEKIPFMGGKDDDDDEEGGKGRAATGTGRGRRLPVQETIDIGASVEDVYDQFTQFEDFPQFMHRVEKVEQRDETTLMWSENIWGIRRSYEVEIVEQDPCRRIEFRSKGPIEMVGVITFHKLADTLTRVAWTIDFQPKGFLEKSASGFRLTRRAIRSDLMRFKAYIEMRDDSTGEWRGKIEEGEVVEQEDDARAEDEGEEPESASEEDFEDEEEEDEEPAEEEPVAEEEPDDVEDEREDDSPRRRRKGRFSRSSDDEDEYDDEEDFEDEEQEEPVAEEEPEDVEEEEEPERPKRKAKPRAKRRASSSSSRSRSRATSKSK